MLDVPGPHFALSEILIVLAAIICTAKFGKVGLWLGAAGSLLFGVIAAIGAFRFSVGMIDALADTHRAFSQIGGAIAMSLIAGQLLLLRSSAGSLTSKAIYCLVLIGGAAVLFLPSATMPLFLIWLAVAIGAAALLPAHRPQTRITRALLISIFLINIAAVRQSPTLGIGMSWHLFHILVAAWLLGLLWVIFGSRMGGHY